MTEETPNSIPSVAPGTPPTQEKHEQVRKIAGPAADPDHTLDWSLTMRPREI